MKWFPGIVAIAIKTWIGNPLYQELWGFGGAIIKSTDCKSRYLGCKSTLPQYYQAEVLTIENSNYIF